MDHPSEDWKDETLFPEELKSKKKRFLNRDIRFSSVDRGDEDDLWRCFVWELYRTIIYCGETPTSLDPRAEFPFYIPSFPKRAYLSHDKKERCSWQKFMGQIEDIDKDDDRLLSKLSMQTQIFDYDPVMIGTRGRGLNMGIRKRKHKLKSFRRKLELELFVNPNWTKEKLKNLFENQIKEIYQEIQWKKKYLEKERRVIPFVHVNYTSDLDEKGFRKLVEQQTEEVCKIMKSDEKYFQTLPDKFEPKNKSLITSLKSKLKLLGHYRLRFCVDLGWRQTISEFANDEHKALVSEDRFKSRIRKYFTNLPCS